MAVWFRSHLQILLILALVLASTSPACKFISGQEGMQAASFINCHDDGTPIKKAAEGCAFCFLQTNIKTAAAPVFVFEGFSLAVSSFIPDADAKIILQALPLSFQPRGPPVLLDA